MEVQNSSELPWSNSSGELVMDKVTEIWIFKLLLLTALTIANFLLNFRVVCIILTMPPKKRNANILIAHLSLLNILLNYFMTVIVVSRCNILALENVYGFCVGHAYFRNSIISLIPVNVTAIAYEKMKALRPNFVGQKLLIKRTISFMWITVLLGSLPNLLSTQYITAVDQQSIGKCRLQLILGSLRLTFSFELLRLVFYHVITTVYISYALIQIKSKVSKYLFSTSNEITSVRVKRKVRKIRYIVLNGVAFIFVWLPTVILLFFFKIGARSGESGESSTTESKTGIIFILMVFLGYTFIMLNPLIHLHLSEHLGDLKWYSMTYRRVSAEATAGNDNNIIGENTVEPVTNEGNREIDSIYTSRASTFHQSSATDSQVYRLQQTEKVAQEPFRRSECTEEFV